MIDTAARPCGHTDPWSCDFGCRVETLESRVKTLESVPATTVPTIIKNMEAEIARLRKIEKAAREHIAWQYRVPRAPRFPLSMLRDALAAWR